MACGPTITSRMAVVIYVSQPATPTVRGKITAKTDPPCPLAAARGCVMPVDTAGHGGCRLCRLAGHRIGQYAHFQQCARLVILALILVMRPFASHPVSTTVTVSGPGSGYVRSAAVHAGVPGHPAADAGDCTQATNRQAPRRTVMITADCVPSNGRSAPQQPRAADPARPVRPVSLQLRALLAGDDQGGPGRTRGGPDRALSASRMVRVQGLSWGFAGGRCWVRTNVGLADGFTARPFLPIGIPADLLFLHFPPCEYRVLSVWRP